MHAVGEYALMSASDWRDPLLEGAQRIDDEVRARALSDWPGYAPARAVSAWRLDRAIAAVWDFGVFGGSFSEEDAGVLTAAADVARADRLPLLTLVRSGGTRLQEGIAALVGIPRARLALRELALAGLPHLSVADAPTTGGVWISVTAGADLRVAVAGATVAFAGPRVAEAFTGTLPEPGSHTAESAYAAGLVDALLPGDEVAGWLDRVLVALAPATATSRAGAARPPAVPTRSGWEQVVAARGRTRGGRALLEDLLEGAVALRAPHGDPTVWAAVGRYDGQPVVGVAVAAELGQRPTPDGYRLAARAYRLADRLQLPLLSLVDTPGADPGTQSEEAGIAPAMGEALDALLTCRSPTLAWVHGEGGSGGALAAATTDLLLLGPDSYFAAIGPEGAAAALRRPAQECADAMGITPADLLRVGFADGMSDGTDLASHVASLRAMPASARLARRTTRWGSAVGTDL